MCVIYGLILQGEQAVEAVKKNLEEKPWRRSRTQIFRIIYKKKVTACLSSKQTVFAAIVSVILFAALSIIFNITEIGAAANVSEIKIISIKDFSNILFSKYALPFEVASVLLLAALVGSVVLAVRDSRKVGEEQAGKSYDKKKA